MVTRSRQAEHATVSVRVPFAASSVALTRRQLKSWLSEQGFPRERIEDARVVVSELVGNSVRHAEPLPDGTILVSWVADDSGLRLSVTDGGSAGRPMRVNASSSALGGRGMSIVDMLAVSWWAEQNRSRSTVHAVLEMA